MLRLADLLAGLSRLADLGFGLQPGEALRSSALTLSLARSLDVPDDDARTACYTALLHHVGCTGYAHETAMLFGDELAFNLAAARTDAGSARDVLATFLPTLTHGRPAVERAKLALVMLSRGKRVGEEFTTAACEVGRDAARRLHLPEEVQRSLYHVYELWQGGGVPGGLAGDAIPLPSRLARLTGVAVLFDTLGGDELAAEAVRRRGGGMLDPDLAAHFAQRARPLLAELRADDPRTLVLEGEPPPAVSVPEPQLREVATVFGDLADLKSPYAHGHSRGVAALARAAGERAGVPPATVADLELAGLLHDVGRVAVPTSVWDKPGRLTSDEWEQVRLHPYYSERILAGSQRLSLLASLAGRHHERLDGSGYHRGSTGADLSMPDRVLAAADAYQTVTEPRPYRSAASPEQAEQSLLSDARRGALDAEAVRAVLAVAGRGDRGVRRERPAGLSEREATVLGLLAQGRSNADIAAQLVISRRTAEHHVQHIYTKIGVSSRAAAALFAMEHGLVPRAAAGGPASPQ